MLLGFYTSRCYEKSTLPKIARPSLSLFLWRTRLETPRRQCSLSVPLSCTCFSCNLANSFPASALSSSVSDSPSHCLSLLSMCLSQGAGLEHFFSLLCLSLSLSRPENLNQASKVPGPSEEEKKLCKQGKCLNGGTARMHTPRRNQNLQFRVSFMPA